MASIILGIHSVRSSQRRRTDTPIETLATDAESRIVRRSGDLIGAQVSSISADGRAIPLSLLNETTTQKRQEAVHNLGFRHDLIGREDLIGSLFKRVADIKQPLVLFGPPGIGKSSVAVELGYELSARPPSGSTNVLFSHIVFSSARLRALDVATLVDDLARWTGNVYVMKLVDQEQKRIEILKILARIPVLLILDNMEIVSERATYDFIQAVPHPSRVICTSRRRHTEIVSAQHFEIPPISEQSSMQLLQKELTTISSTKNDLSPLLGQLEAFTRCNPLAIKWAVGQMQVLPLTLLIRSIENGSGDLFEEMFDRSWSRISDGSRKILMALTMFRAPPTMESLLYVATVDTVSENSTVAELRSLRLLECSEEQQVRYTLHPLAHSFASAKLGASITEVRIQLHRRFVEYHRDLVSKRGGRDWDDPTPFEQIDAERESYLFAVRLAYDNGNWRDVLVLVDGLRNYLLIYGYWRQRVELCRLGLSAAEELGDSRVLGRFLRHLGWTMVLQGELDGAAQNLSEARKIAVDQNDVKGQADATGDLAEVARLRGDLVKARALRLEALELTKRGGVRRDIYVEQALLAQLDLEEKSFTAARRGFEASLKLAEDLRWHRAIAYCLHWLGEVARLNNERELAKSYLSQSKKYLERFHDRARLALIRKSEALLLAADGEDETARRVAAEAAEELGKLGLWYELSELYFLTGAAEEFQRISPSGAEENIGSSQLSGQGQPAQRDWRSRE